MAKIASVVGGLWLLFCIKENPVVVFSWGRLIAVNLLRGFRNRVTGLS